LHGGSWENVGQTGESATGEGEGDYGVDAPTPLESTGSPFAGDPLGDTNAHGIDE